MAANPYVTPNQWAVVDMASYSVLVILAGSTSLRALGRAVERIEHVIVGNPVDPDEAAKRAAAPKPAQPEPPPDLPSTSPRPIEPPAPTPPAAPTPSTPPERRETRTP